MVRDACGTTARFSSVAGGSLWAAGFIFRWGEMILEEMWRAFAMQDHNFDLNGLTSDEDGKTPHRHIYRTVVTRVLSEFRKRSPGKNHIRY